ncbi:N-acetylneuraminate lyase-like [Mizuhopecten yessoensis]|uniref:N-acetylneuraminate lyase n=1 Tax=Mizuhopecten yessoensis TaxID=6573 RepID=A0A210PLY9_MIZYE|nr:N-acetylneuraminate lyase-like [Mizuhopecten yessoensis]OWF37509.1 N-acetylneuraminate lyase [Mizuhopecten yessoensis]
MEEQQKIRNFRIRGAVSAPFTAFKPNGEINYEIIPAFCSYLKDHHFEYAYVNGTLGEGMSLTIEERKKSLEAWVEAADGKIGIIAHVGANNLRDSQVLARHAEDVGVDAIAALAPSFFKPTNEEALVEYMAAVAGMAPKTPFYYYCINYVTGIYLNAAKFLRLAKDKIPTLCGLKHSSKELTSAHSCMMVDKDRFQVMCGTDVQYITALSLGIDVPVSVAFMGDVFYNLKTAYDKGDMASAMKFQEQAQLIDTLRDRPGGAFPIAKRMFTIISGLDMGPVRLPLKDICKEQEDSLRKDIDALGLWK